MIIHQAIYGEKRGGHSLLSHSNSDSVPFDKILDRTDLQGAMPPGAAWNSYLSGFNFESHYVLMRTHPDPTASRGGMVFSHALFLPIDTAVRMSSLEPASKLLLPDASTRLLAGPAELSADPTLEGNETDPTSVPGLERLMRLLFLSNTRPVVWIGQEGFEKAVFGLWRSLWPEMRISLNFKLAFGPQDAYLADFMVVCTPDSLASRWAGFTTTADKDVSSETPRGVRRFMSANATSELREFAKELGLEVKSMRDFNLLDQAHSYIQTENRTLQETLAAARLLASLSPNPKAGVGTKGKIVARLQQQVGAASAAQIRMMRNLDTRPFLDGQKIWDAVSNWTELTAESATTVADSFVPLLLQALGSPEIDWARAIMRGTDGFLWHDKGVVARQLWSWWTAEPALSTLLFQKVPNSVEFEDALRVACPGKVDPLIAEPILVVCRERLWFKLHATLATATFEVQAAIELHLSFDRLPISTAGVQILMDGVGEEERLDQALKRKDPRLVNIAGVACAGKPALLRRLDLQNEVARNILLAALDSNPAILDQFSGSTKLLADLVDCLMSGEAVSPTLWVRIASAGWGNLALHPRRKEVWNHLSGEGRTALLAATADGWLSGLLQSSAVENSIEPPLQEAIIEPTRLGNFLRSTIPKQVHAGINLFERFPVLPEQRFDTWLIQVSTACRQLDAETSSRIGRLIKARGWGNCAARVAEDVTQYGRSDLLPAAYEFVELLGFRQRKRVLKASAVQERQRPLTSEKGDAQRAVVLTALEVEFKAVFKHLFPLRTERHSQGTIYEVGRFLAQEDTLWEIAVVQTGAGNAVAAVEAERAISHFNPSYVIFVGVAGGLKDVQLGDVVAATKVYGYETGKAEQEFHTRAEIGQSSYPLVQLAKKVARDMNWQRRITDGFAHRPDAFVAPIAAGEKVVASVSSSVYQLLRNSFGDAVAVEMEGSGFLRAGYANPNVLVLVVRGISDLIEGKSDADARGSQIVASAHAAAFALEVIANIQVIS